MRERSRIASAWIFSIVGHLTLAGLSGLVLAHSFAPKPVAYAPVATPPVRDGIEIELPTMSNGSVFGDPVATPPDQPVPEPRGGGEATARLDSGHAGRGGTDATDTPALNLADRDDHIALSPDPMSRLDRSQIQRVESSKKRASREDRRSSREPMELTFIAEGKDGSRRERRVYSDRDPSAGALHDGVMTREGGALGGSNDSGDDGDRGRGDGDERGGAFAGGDRTHAGSGVRDGALGGDHRDSARVALARPWVEQGVPSVPANREGKPADNKDSEQEVSQRVEAFLHASGAGGLVGAGQGGQQAPGAPGAGGLLGLGSKAHALGSGHGPGVDVDPRDARRNEYLRAIKSKIYPLWSFPKWAALEGMQGMVIVNVTIRADGSIAAPVVTRQSGIPEFDENCRKAVVRAAPFPPVPSELGASFTPALRFDSPNPAVRPQSGGARD